MSKTSKVTAPVELDDKDMNQVGGADGAVIFITDSIEAGDPQPLKDTDLDSVRGGGQDGSDLLIVNNGDGSDFLEADSRDGDSVITMPGPGGGPHVRVFDGSS